MIAVGQIWQVAKTIATFRGRRLQPGMVFVIYRRVSWDGVVWEINIGRWGDYDVVRESDLLERAGLVQLPRGVE